MRRALVALVCAAGSLAAILLFAIAFGFSVVALTLDALLTRIETGRWRTRILDRDPEEAPR